MKWTAGRYFNALMKFTGWRTLNLLGLVALEFNLQSLGSNFQCSGEIDLWALSQFVAIGRLGIQLAITTV